MKLAQAETKAAGCNVSRITNCTAMSGEMRSAGGVESRGEPARRLANVVRIEMRCLVDGCDWLRLLMTSMLWIALKGRRKKTLLTKPLAELDENLPGILVEMRLSCVDRLKGFGRGTRLGAALASPTIAARVNAGRVTRGRIREFADDPAQIGERFPKTKAATWGRAERNEEFFAVDVGVQLGVTMLAFNPYCAAAETLRFGDQGP